MVVGRRPCGWSLEWWLSALALAWARHSVRSEMPAGCSGLARPGSLGNPYPMHSPPNTFDLEVATAAERKLRSTVGSNDGSLISRTSPGGSICTTRGPCSSLGQSISTAPDKSARLLKDLALQLGDVTLELLPAIKDHRSCATLTRCASNAKLRRIIRQASADAADRNPAHSLLTAGGL